MRSPLRIAPRLGLLVLIAGLGCSNAVFQSIDGSGQGGTGGAGTGAGGRGGSNVGGDGGGAQAGTGGATAGTGGVVAGGGTGGGGTTGGGGGGSAGTLGRGGAGGGGTTGSAGTGGSGTAGSVAGTSGGGRGGGSAGTGGGGTAGSVAGSGGGGRGGGGGGTGGTVPDGGLPVRPTGAGQIVITELMHDTDGIDDALGEWFEIYNPGTVTYDLQGCQIRDIAPTNLVTINTQLLVPPGAFRVLSIGASPGFTPDYVYSIVRFDNDFADQANILCNSIIIDTFPYPDADATAVAGRGHSFSVDPDHYTTVDNDVRANWCYGANQYIAAGTPNFGTPGAPNPQCP